MDSAAPLIKLLTEVFRNAFFNLGTSSTCFLEVSNPVLLNVTIIKVGFFCVFIFLVNFNAWHYKENVLKLCYIFNELR